jgi:hypothetical protein
MVWFTCMGKAGANSALYCLSPAICPSVPLSPLLSSIPGSALVRNPQSVDRHSAETVDSEWCVPRLAYHILLVHSMQPWPEMSLPRNRRPAAAAPRQLPIDWMVLGRRLIAKFLPLHNAHVWLDPCLLLLAPGSCPMSLLKRSCFIAACTLGERSVADLPL